MKAVLLMMVFFVSLMVPRRASAEAGPDIECKNALGDVNQNGGRSGLDSVLVSRYLAGLSSLTPCQLVAADADSNGIVNAGDSWLIASSRNLPAQFGDMDGDGQVSYSDQVTVARYIRNEIPLNEAQRHLADVDQNGRITIDDFWMIANSQEGVVQLPIPVKGRATLPTK